MRVTAAVSVLIVPVLTLSLGGQTREGVMGELLRDVNTAQMKIVGLAKAMPAAAYEWRPNKGVRSTAEVLMHVAADNYFIPTLMGATPPAETGINGKEYSTAEAFEKRTMTREQIIAELEKSFDFLKTSMNNTPDAKLEAPRESGKQGTNRGLWISATTHLHEHLGQLIAYARSNNVTPPWSK